jgi:hypothetical protein
MQGQVKLIIGCDTGRANVGICGYDRKLKSISLSTTFKFSLALARRESQFNPSAYRVSAIDDEFFTLLSRLEKKFDPSEILGVVEDYAYGADNLQEIVKRSKGKDDLRRRLNELLKNSDRDPWGLAECSGVILANFARFKIPFIKIPPTQLKLFITGDGRAPKTLMMKTLKAEYGVALDTDHEFDALGLCHIGRYFCVFCENPGAFKKGYEREVMSSIAFDGKYRDVAIAINPRSEVNRLKLL